MHMPSCIDVDTDAYAYTNACSHGGVHSYICAHVSTRADGENTATTLAKTKGRYGASRVQVRCRYRVGTMQLRGRYGASPTQARGKSCVDGSSVFNICTFIRR